MKEVHRLQFTTHYTFSKMSLVINKGRDRKSSRSLFTMPIGEEFMTLILERREALHALKKMKKNLVKA
jgi:hypothetical protein